MEPLLRMPHGELFLKRSSQPMRLVVNATNIGEDLSGIGRYSLSLAQYLLQHWDGDFQVVINQRALGHFRGTADWRRIRVVDGRVSPDHGLSGHLLRLFFTNLLSIQHPRSLIFNTSQLEAALFRKNQILTVHDLIPMLFRRYHRRQYYYFKYLLPLVLKRSRMIITDTHVSKRLIVERYRIPEDKIRVIYLGVSETLFNGPSDGQNKPYILYVGRLSRAKNIQGLIRAFEILSDRFGLNVTLKLTGSRAQIPHELDGEVSTRISFLGAVSDHALAELYRKASLLVLPSFCEGFGLPAIEAMACGCPVVASNVGALTEVCGDAAEYVNPYDVESIAEGLYRVITDEALRSQLIARGLERSRLFRLENTARDHIRVFQEAMHSP